MLHCSIIDCLRADAFAISFRQRKAKPVAAKIIPNPNYEERVRASFARQNAMATIGAELTLVTPGIVEIEMPFRRR